MLKFITVIVICYFGKLENNKSSIFGPATIFWTRDNLPATRDNLPAIRDTRRLDYLVNHEPQASDLQIHRASRRSLNINAVLSN